MTITKNDLVSLIQNEKYYAERDLERLTLDNTLPYVERLGEITLILETIALCNSKLMLADQYFMVKSPQPKQQVMGEAKPKVEVIDQPVVGPDSPQEIVSTPSQPHDGQSHGE